jgi:hypothetical protein
VDSRRYGRLRPSSRRSFSHRVADSGFAYQIDLIDEHLALDRGGNGRGFITFNLHWKHASEVFGLKPTGREGTSVETMLLTIAHGKVTKIHVGDNSLDLVLYMWERGWPHPHNVRPEPIVRGVDRSKRPSPVGTALG